MSPSALVEVKLISYLLVGFVFLFLSVSTTLFLSYFCGHSIDWSWQLNHSTIAIIVYYTGLVGYRSSDTPAPQVNGHSLKKLNRLEKERQKEDVILAQQLEDAFKVEKIHLNSKLHLRDVALLLNVNEDVLSGTINRHYQKNFRSVVNEKRIAEVKRRLTDRELDKLSLARLAQECGFNSEASFYRVFKKETGFTPRQFLGQHE